MNIEDLFKIKICYLDENQKLKNNGEVIAVSTYVDKRRVCFLIEGEKRGRWFSEKELTGTDPDKEEIKKEFIRLVEPGEKQRKLLTA